MGRALSDLSHFPLVSFAAEKMVGNMLSVSLRRSAAQFFAKLVRVALLGGVSPKDGKIFSIQSMRAFVKLMKIQEGTAYRYFRCLREARLVELRGDEVVLVLPPDWVPEIVEVDFSTRPGRKNERPVKSGVVHEDVDWDSVLGDTPTVEGEAQS